MPEMNGIEAETRRIVSVHPDVADDPVLDPRPEGHPRPAAASGAIAYVSEERLAADTIRDLWNTRDSGTFTSR